MNADNALLQAALVGYQSELTRIDQAIAELRGRLGQAGVAAGAEPVQKPRRKMSASARKRIAAAQKKRWAEYKRLKGK